ncbi:ShTK domain containing protein, partial [Aphelenchoides avenae]
MTVECPVTCNRCGAISGTGAGGGVAPVVPGVGTGPPVATCRNRGNDCPKVPHLCNNQAYYKLMTQQCAATCNRCATPIRGRGKFIYGRNETEGLSSSVLTRTTPNLRSLR